MFKPAPRFWDRLYARSPAVAYLLFYAIVIAVVMLGVALFRLLGLTVRQAASAVVASFGAVCVWHVVRQMARDR